MDPSERQTPEAASLSEQRTTLVVAMITSFITSFYGSALNLSVPAIGAEFNVSASLVGWVVEVFILTVAAVSVPFGSIADRVSKKRILITGIAVFSFAALACGFSVNIVMLLILRAVGGVGAAMIFATNAAVLISATPPQNRGKVIGLQTSAVYVGLSLGPVLGGALNTNLGWRSIFFVSFAICMASLFSAITKLPKEKPSDETVGEVLAADAPGNAFYVLMVVCLMLGLSYATQFPKGPAFLALGALFTVLFIRRELRAERPAIRIDMFTRNKPFTFMNVATMLNYGAMFVISYSVSLLLQVVYGYTAQAAGLIMITQPVIMAVAAPLTGRLSDKVDAGRLAACGMGVCALSLFLMTFLRDGTPVVQIVLTLVVCGIGMGLFSSPNMNAIMRTVDKKDFGFATSIVSTMRTMGSTACMAIITMIVTLYLGRLALSEAPPDQMLKVMHTVFIINTLFCIAGIFISLTGRRKAAKGR